MRFTTDPCTSGISDEFTIEFGLIAFKKTFDMHDKVAPVSTNAFVNVLLILILTKFCSIGVVLWWEEGLMFVAILAKSI